MKRLASAVFALFLIQSNANLGGEWAVTLTLPLGDTWFNMFIVQKDTQLTGYMLNESGQFDLKGTIAKDQVKFQWDYPDGGKILTIVFTGKVDKNSLSGRAKVGDVGEGPMTAQKK
jgi:hypothetical protein